jgi:hypothetical protein
LHVDLGGALAFDWDSPMPRLFLSRNSEGENGAAGAERSDGRGGAAAAGLLGRGFEARTARGLAVPPPPAHASSSIRVTTGPGIYILD